MGCTSISEIAVTQPSNDADATQSPILLTETATFIPTPTLLATLETTPALTSTIELQATSDLEAIPTPQGTGRRQQVLWLYETNNGCNLPCWWGITPRVTTWDIAYNFLRGDIQLEIQSTSSESDDLQVYEAKIPLFPDIFLAEETRIFILVKEGVVEEIDARVSMGNTPDGYFPQYELASFLVTYGQPLEIWLSTSPSPFEHNELPFRVILYYPEHGITALFSDNAVKVGDFVIGCPQENPVSALTLWSRSRTRSFQEVISSKSVYNMEFLSLEEATEMDVKTFYETFKNSENPVCLETVADLWR